MSERLNPDSSTHPHTHTPTLNFGTARSLATPLLGTSRTFLCGTSSCDVAADGSVRGVPCVCLRDELKRCGICDYV